MISSAVFALLPAIVGLAICRKMGCLYLKWNKERSLAAHFSPVGRFLLAVGASFHGDKGKLLPVHDFSKDLSVSYIINKVLDLGVILYRHTCDGQRTGVQSKSKLELRAFLLWKLRLFRRP